MDNKPSGLIDRLKLSFAGGKTISLAAVADGTLTPLRTSSPTPSPCPAAQQHTHCFTVFHSHPGAREEFTESQDEIGAKDNQQHRQMRSLLRR
jgi:hypothetical protein